MPEFILDHGSPETAKTFRALDSFTQGYIEAMFFTETGTGDDAENDLEHASVADLAPDTLQRIAADCTRFQEEHGSWLAGYYFEHEPEQAGRDFWYTRNDHGTGYWDRETSPDGGGCTKAVLERLAELARACGNVDLYRGDDGLIYLA